MLLLLDRLSNCIVIVPFDMLTNYFLVCLISMFFSESEGSFLFKKRKYEF